MLKPLKYWSVAQSVALTVATVTQSVIVGCCPRANVATIHREFVKHRTELDLLKDMCAEDTHLRGGYMFIDLEERENSFVSAQRMDEYAQVMIRAGVSELHGQKKYVRLVIRECRYPRREVQIGYVHQPGGEPLSSNITVFHKLDADWYAFEMGEL